MKKRHLLFAIVATGLIALTDCGLRKEPQPTDHGYLVGAYIWPSCHDEPRSREVFWGAGIGEWEIIQKGDPRFAGHDQPRIPLWGYEMDDDPVAFEKKIRAATDHGINLFVFDWYWYDGEPFLESCLNNGFLGAPNNDLMQFYIMWANHDVRGTMWNRYRYQGDTIIWNGEVTWEDYEVMVDRIIRQYFTLPNYLKIDGKPVFSVFSFRDMFNSFGDLEGTRKALDLLRSKAEEAGLPGVHFQIISRGPQGKAGLIPDELAGGKDLDEIIAYLDVNSMTTYNWRMAGIIEDYVQWGNNWIDNRRTKWDSLLEIPYYPVVSLGWDNTPRYGHMGQEDVVHINATPEAFAAYLQEAKDYLATHPEHEKIIMLNAWNEWVEGACLEPDMIWGYKYLEAVRKVMSGRYDRY